MKFICDFGIVKGIDRVANSCRLAGYWGTLAGSHGHGNPLDGRPCRGSASSPGA